MKRYQYLIPALALLVALPAAAKKEKKGGPLTRERALREAPLFADYSIEQERGQRLLAEACAAMRGPNSICDLVIKDAEFEGFFFDPDTGVMKTTIAAMDLFPDDELRAAFAWAIAYAESGTRTRAVSMQDKRFDFLDGLAVLNPSVGVGTARYSRGVVVGGSVAVGPAALLPALDALLLAVEDARLASDLERLDAKTIKKLAHAGFRAKGLIRVLERMRKDNDLLRDRATGLGTVDQRRLRKAREIVRTTPK